jgi:hypothetical protein
LLLLATALLPLLLVHLCLLALRAVAAAVVPHPWLLLPGLGPARPLLQAPLLAPASCRQGRAALSCSARPPRQQRLPRQRTAW